MASEDWNMGKDSDLEGSYFTIFMVRYNEGLSAYVIDYSNFCPRVFSTYDKAKEYKDRWYSRFGNRAEVDECIEEWSDINDKDEDQGLVWICSTMSPDPTRY
jgi:hypothetical protein